MQPSRAPGSPGFAVFAALEHRHFRRLWLSTVLSSVSRWAMVVGQGWLIYDRSGSSTLVGVGTLAAMSPFILAPLLGGPLADRFDRKRLAGASFALNFLLLGLLALLTLVGLVEVWHIIAIAFLSGAARSVEMTAGQSLLPSLVPRERLLNAVALMSLARHGARLVGPAAAVPLLLTMGAGGAFAVSAGLYGLATIAVLAVGVSSQGRASDLRRVFSHIYDALCLLYRSPALALIMGLVGAHCALTMSYEAVLPQFAQENLAGGGGTYTILFMAVGAGSVVATLGVASLWRDPVKGRWLLLTGVASGLAPIALGLSPSYSVAVVLAGLVGAAQAGFMALTNAFVLQAVPDGVRGRMTSLYNMHAGGTMGVANLINGQIADHFGAPTAFIATGIAFLVVLSMLSQLGPSLRSVYRTGVVPVAGE